MKLLIPLVALVAAPVAAKPPAPRLIVAISVDQFSADLFAEYRQHYTGGLKRLSNAIVFPSSYQSHAATETCPGHSTILTGSHPARTGIIANTWFDEGVTRTGKAPHAVYCAEDERAPGSSVSDYVVSPEHLKVPTLGDRMKRADPRSRVVSVAGKDRAAVMMGGHMTDAIWYLDPKKGRSYVTLQGRDQTPPSVVQTVNARVAAIIDRPPATTLPAKCRAQSIAIPTLPDGPVVGQLKPHDAGDVKAFRTSPDFDRATADIAIGFIGSMKLGHGPAPDILAIGLSANDYVGHAFGTEGAEMCAQQVELDQTVGRILAALDANGAPYAVVLTADHGGYDIPERHQERGFADAARVDPALDPRQLAMSLVTDFKVDVPPEELLLADGAQGDWYLSHKVPDELRPQMLSALEARLSAFPQVAAVLTADDLRRMAPPRPPVDDWSLVEKARASFDPSRSGDLIVLLKPRVISIAKPAPLYTATHGSPWNYDRRVPMLFWYSGATAHEEPLSVETVDILPTLAALIDLPVPQDEIDGRCIDLDPTAASTCS
ncbi:alkaline phosphatase family protein (plasmid) [Sphingomonas paeninsulae]|uniref:Alkaline phosphatase n=2 Tax=Sphingomonas paeninsulae TaxID=2319844 RepID=A0A494TC93_SPHPE|nr:alkaline phosphatase family protein [Sphingomonas paeninsulae]